MARTDADLDNLRAAFTWAVDRGDLDVALGIPVALWFQVFNRPVWGVGRWAEDAVSRAGVDDHPDARAVLGVALAGHNIGGDLGAADACWERVLEIDRRTGRAPETIALMARGTQLANADGVEEAIRLYGILEEASAAGDPIMRMVAQSNLANFRFMTGDRSAMGLAEEGLHAAHAIGNPSVIAMALYAVGYTHQLDDPARSIECFRDGIEQFGRIGSTFMIEVSYVLLIRLHALHGDLRAALDSFRAGLRLSYEQGSRVNVIYHLKQGALALQRAGRSEVAAVLLGYIEIQPQRGTEGWEGEFHDGVIAEVRAALGDAALRRGRGPRCGIGLRRHREVRTRRGRRCVGEGATMTALPSGTVTFLFTDLEGSTRLWEEHPEAMQPALGPPRRDRARRDRGPRRSRGEDDRRRVPRRVRDRARRRRRRGGRAASRSRPSPGRTAGPLLVRMGLHTGEAELRDGDYYGSAVNRAARLMSVAHGGQVVVSAATAGARAGRARSSWWISVSTGCATSATPEQVFQVAHPTSPAEFPPLQSVDALPGNLPLQPNPFVGRAARSRQVTDLVADAAVVTLTGAGRRGQDPARARRSRRAPARVPRRGLVRATSPRSRAPSGWWRPCSRRCGYTAGRGRGRRRRAVLPAAAPARCCS